VGEIFSVISTLWKKLAGTKTPSFTTNLFSRTAWEISLVFFGVAFSIIIARCLGPYGKGVINTIQQFIAFAGLFASPGIYDALQYHIASKRCETREGIANYIFFTLIYSFPLTFLLLFLSPFFTHNILKGVPLPLLIVSLIFFLLGIYFSPLSILLGALQRFPQLAISGFISLIAKLFFLFLFLIVLKMNVWGAMLPDWLLFPISLFLGFYFLQDVLNISFFKPGFNKEILKSLLNYSWKTFIAGIFGRTTLRVDVFFLNYFFSPTVVGLYMTGVSYTEFIRLFPSAISTVLFPRTAAVEEGEAVRLTTLILRSFLLFLMPVAGLLLLLSSYIIPLLYGIKFVPSIKVVGYLLPGVIGNCYAGIFGSYLSGRGHPELTLYSIGPATLVTLVGDYLLIPAMGIKGAALVSSFAYCTNFFLLLYFFSTMTGARLKDIFIPKIEDIKYITVTLKEKLQKWSEMIKTNKGV